MAIGLAKAGLPAAQHLPTLYLLKNHNLIFLGLAMAAGKAIADPARDVEFASVVTAMCRNGTEFGIRVSGLGDEWFTAPPRRWTACTSPGIRTRMPGWTWAIRPSPKRSAGAALSWAARPGSCPWSGGTPEQALAYTREMKTITVTRHPQYLMPAFGFEGAPIGIDIRKVVQTGSTPIIDTAIAHKDPGYPKIGAAWCARRWNASRKRWCASARNTPAGKLLGGDPASKNSEAVWHPDLSIRKNQYYDSVFLMRVAKTLSDEPGVEQSAVVMATEANKELLAEIGIRGPAVDAATPNDLVVALVARDEAAVKSLLDSLDERLTGLRERRPAHPLPVGGGGGPGGSAGEPGGHIRPGRVRRPRSAQGARAGKARLRVQR